VQANPGFFCPKFGVRALFEEMFALQSRRGPAAASLVAHHRNAAEFAAEQLIKKVL
jgi:hypothetical protein